MNKLGKKWSEYAAELNRTEHAVKNRYNSVLIKQKKLTPHIHKEEKIIAIIIEKLSQHKDFEDKEDSAKKRLFETSDNQDKTNNEQ